MNNVHPGAGGHIGGHTGGDLLSRQIQRLADGGGHGHGVDHKAAGGRGRQPVGCLVGGDGAGDALDAPVIHIGDADIAPLPSAAAQDGLRQGDGVQQRIVAVEDGDAVGRQILEYLALGL